MLRGTLAALSAAVVAALLLSGCTSEPPSSPAAPAPSTTSTPAFTSKQEAFAAAEKVYRRYMSLTNRALHDPANADLSGFRAVATDEAFAEEQKTYERAQGENLRTRGTSELKVFRAQNVRIDRGSVTAYACVDYSGVRVLNHDGKDVTPGSRPDTRSSVVEFLLVDGSLRFAGQHAFAGKRLC